MKRIIMYTIFGLLVIILGVFINRYQSNPLRKSEEKLREDYLKLTPIGTSMEDVVKLIESKNEWRIVYTLDFGFVVDRGRARVPSNEEITENKTIGVKTIKAYIGSYSDILNISNMFNKHVEVYWGFDDNSYLVGVGISKSSDSF